MTNKAADILHLLEMELDVLEKGGFGRSVRDPQHQEPILKHSVSCINHWLVPEHRTDCCDGCLLLDFVPDEHQDEAIPCHFVPLNESGVTVDSLQQLEDEGEMVELVKDWLRKTIAQLKQQRPRAGESTQLDY